MKVVIIPVMKAGRGQHMIGRSVDRKFLNQIITIYIEDIEVK
jgi:diphthamide synthase (EF-2-diphthine--ammonia ligase)